MDEEFNECWMEGYEKGYEEEQWLSREEKMFENSIEEQKQFKKMKDFEKEWKSAHWDLDSPYFGLPESYYQCMEGPVIFWADFLFNDLRKLKEIKDITLVTIDQQLEAMEKAGSGENDWSTMGSVYRALSSLKDYIHEEWENHEPGTQ